MEICRQHPDPIDAVFVPVGGGGLIAGMASFLKTVRPGTRIIGVEPADANAMDQSLRRGARVRLEEVGLFADGVAVRQVGRETFETFSEFLEAVGYPYTCESDNPAYLAFLQ